MGGTQSFLRGESEGGGGGVHLVRNQSLKTVQLHRHPKRTCMLRACHVQEGKIS